MAASSIVALALLPFVDVASWIAEYYDRTLFDSGIVSLTVVGFGLVVGFTVTERLAVKRAYEPDRGFELIAGLGVSLVVVGVVLVWPAGSLL